MTKPGLCACGNPACPLSGPRPSTAAAPSSTAGTFYTFPTFQGGATSEPNGNVFLSPAPSLRSLELEERNTRSLQRIAVALEKLVGVFVPD